ncbi:hypothetical protein [Nocardioides rubriscoriae]|uniref:hypothetical protein n=1 Tax=Nocardioides rubriscoriae TaxID=642762 RepID=UPI0011DF840F|nr:hypothetical protein [Nocardioides rubriscoriae]
MRDNPRTTVVSALLGVVLLGGVVVFTVLVPKLGDDPQSSSGSSSESSTGGAGATPAGPIDLPDELPGMLVAADLGTLPPQLAQSFPAAADLMKQEDSIAEGLQKVFGVPGAFRLYAATDASAVAQLTVLDRAPGLFTPDTPPIDPAVIGLARASSELVKVDDAVCSVNYGDNSQVPAGQPIDPAQQPQAVRCQLGAGERTYEATTQGLTVDATVELLHGLADA